MTANIVMYTLSAEDVARRGSHDGNDIHLNDTFPMLIVREWEEGKEHFANGQVFLDGNDVLWVSAVQQGQGAGKFE
jgi:hypothetical protein